MRTRKRVWYVTVEVRGRQPVSQELEAIEASTAIRDILRMTVGHKDVAVSVNCVLMPVRPGERGIDRLIDRTGLERDPSAKKGGLR